VSSPALAAVPGEAARQRWAAVGDGLSARQAAAQFGRPLQVAKWRVQGFVEPRPEQELAERRVVPERWEPASVLALALPERGRCAASALALVLVLVLPEPARCAAAEAGAKSELAQRPAADGASAAPSSPAPFLFAALAAASRVQTAILEVQVASQPAAREVHAAALRAVTEAHAAVVLREAAEHAVVVLREAAERAAVARQVAPAWGGARSVGPWVPPSAAAWVFLPVPPWPALRPAVRSAHARAELRVARR
jgi:hypothetical protein